MHSSLRGRILSCSVLALAATAGCHNDFVSTKPLTVGSFTINPCSVSGTLQLNVAQTARVDCSNGGTTVTLAGNGASYLVVAQFAVDLVPNALVPYHVSTGTAITASQTRLANGPSASRSHSVASTGELPIVRPRAKQLAFDHMLRARARQQMRSGRWSAAQALSLSKVAT